MARELKTLNAVEMGWRIRIERERLAMTREMLAEALDVSTKFLADIEYGAKGMSIKTLYLLSQVLGVSVDYILDGTKIAEEEKLEREQITQEITALLGRCTLRQLEPMAEISRLYAKAMQEEKQKAL